MIKNIQQVDMDFSFLKNFFFYTKNCGNRISLSLLEWEVIIVSFVVI